jgi:hypothetical protein
LIERFSHGLLFNAGASRTEKLVVCALIAGFCTGTTTHLMDMAAVGFLGYPAPPWINAYWTSLTLLDPLAALLLVFRTRYGVMLGLAIMVSDIAINTGVMVKVDLPADDVNWFRFACQLLFFILMAAYAFYYFRAGRTGRRGEKA